MVGDRQVGVVGESRGSNESDVEAVCIIPLVNDLRDKKSEKRVLWNSIRLPLMVLIENVRYCW
jgi:hypothetical protein